jgi:hypothetical protein
MAAATFHAAALITKCLEELPGRQKYQDFAVGIGAKLPPVPASWRPSVPVRSNIP